MSNKVNSLNSSSLLDNKLAVLLRDYNRLIKDKKVNEQEQLLILFNEAMSSFYKTLNNPLFGDDFSVVPGEQVDYNKLNKMLDTAKKDVEILYLELGSLHQAIVRNFNNVSSVGEKIKSKLRSTRSKVATYKLYSKNTDLHYAGDTFDNYSLIEQNPSLYNEERCPINLVEGVVTLPIDTGKVKTARTSDISIGPTSNGTPGNNQEIGQLQRANLLALSDSTPDTWFEYEIVSLNPTTTPLILELTFTLEEDTVINNLEITPNNFAIRNFPKIVQLQTSLDNNFFTDLLDDIPVGQDLLEDKNDFLTLGAASGKFSGVASFSFKPRKARYVKLKLQQDDHYLVKTPAGLQYRKAIGLRGVDIKSIVYRATGEIVSVRHQLADEAKKVSLALAKNTFDPLTTIESQITHNDQVWTSISPTEDTLENEVIDYNTIEPKSIRTEAPVLNLRYKSVLKRNSDQFNKADQVIKKEKAAVEFIGIDPTTSSLRLSEKPIPSSLSIFGVAYGQTGGAPLTILNGDLVSRDGFTYIYLPRAFRGRDVSGDSFTLFVNREPWTLVTSLAGSSTTDKHYTYDRINKILKTGDGTTGLKMEGSAEIRFKREQVLVSQDNPRTAKLNFVSDSVLESTKFYKLGAAQTVSDLVLQKGTRIFNLGKTDLDSLTVDLDPGSVFLTPQTFIDGSTELTTAGDYSIDLINGVLYSFSETPEDDISSVDFTYRLRTVISGFSIKGEVITLPDSAYSSFENEETLTLVSRYVINLGKTFIEPKSLQFLSLASYFVREVPFKDGQTELNLDLAPTELEGLFSVDYKNGKIYVRKTGGITGDLSVKYRHTSFYAEYNIARMIPKTAYVINDTQIVFSEAFVVDEFGSALAVGTTRNLYRTEYNFIQETRDNLKELEPFYTPFLRGYTLNILPRSNF